MTTSLLAPTQWAQTEFGLAELGDQRRTRRLVEMGCRLARSPTGKLPQAFPEWKELNASYRLLDIVGLDVWAHVTENLYGAVPDDPFREYFTMQPFLMEMIRRQWLGDKTGQGCYKRVGKARDIHALDWKTFEYHPADKPRFASLEHIRTIEPLAGRLIAGIGGVAGPWVFGGDESEKSSYLGVDIVDVTTERLGALKLKEENGVEVTMVDQDAPAGKAGIKEHDVILTMNGSTIESGVQLRRMIHETPPGRMVSCRMATVPCGIRFVSRCGCASE